MEKLTESMLAIASEIEADARDKLSDVLQAAMDNTIQQLRTEKYPRRLGPEFHKAITQTLVNMWQKTAYETADYMQEYFAHGFKSLTTKAAREEIKQRVLSEYIDRYGARQAAQIIRTTEKQVRDMTNGGLARGQSIDLVFREITNKIPALADQRADVISQTEIHATNQFVSQAMAARSGLRLRKMWDAVNDERTRDFGELGRISQFNHRVMNGSTIPVDQQFAVPTITGSVERLLFPGDPKGSAGNIINCRCNQVYIED